MSEELIEDFITMVYTPDFASLVRQAISLFEAFEHENAYSEMMDAITNESVSDLHARGEHFSVALANQLKYLLDHHLVTLTDTATIRDQVDVLDALYRVQHLEDYTAIESILLSDDDSTDMMARLLEELTSMDHGHILTILNEVDKRTLNLLLVFIEQKRRNEESSKKKNDALVLRIKILKEALGPECLGIVITEAGMEVGMPVSLYIPFVEEHLVVENDYRKTATNFLSLLCISDTEESNFLTTYRELAEQHIKSLELSGRVESELTHLIGRINEYRKAHDDKVRLSQGSPS